jgi:hypothetical protein
LHNKTSNKKMSLEICYEKFAEGLLASACTEIQVQGQSSWQTGREIPFLYRVRTTHAKLEGKSQRSCCVCAERSKRQTRKSVKNALQSTAENAMQNYV